MNIFNCGENDDSFNGYIIYMKTEKDEIIPFLSRKKLDFGEVFRINEVIEYNLTDEKYLEERLMPKLYTVLGYEWFFDNKKALQNKINNDFILYLRNFTQGSVSNRWCKMYEHLPFRCVPIFKDKKIIDLYYYLFNRKDNKPEKVANISTIKDYIEKIYLTKVIDDKEIYTDGFGNNIIRSNVFCYYEKTETIDDTIKKKIENFREAIKLKNSEKLFLLSEVSDIYDKEFYNFKDIILRIKSVNSKGDLDNFSVDKIDISITPKTKEMVLYNPNYNLFKYMNWHSISFYFKGKDFKDYEMTIFNLNKNHNWLTFTGCICETHYDEYQINLKNVETPVLDAIKAVYEAKIEKELLEGNEIKPLNLKEDCIQGHKLTDEESTKMQWQEEARAAQQVKECEEALLGQIGEHIGINHNKMPTITSIQTINIKNTNGVVSAIDFIPDSFSIESSTEQTDYESNNPCVLPDGVAKAIVISNSDKIFSFGAPTGFGIPNYWAEMQVLCSADNGKDYWITFSAGDYNTKLERKYFANTLKITGHWHSMEIKEVKEKKVEKMLYPKRVEDIFSGILYGSNHTTYMKDIESLTIDEENKIFIIDLKGQHEYISPYDYNYDIKLSAFDKIKGNYTIQIFLDRDYDDIKSEITSVGSRIIGHFKEIKINDDKLYISKEEAEKHTIKVENTLYSPEECGKALKEMLTRFIENNKCNSRRNELFDIIEEVINTSLGELTYDNNGNKIKEEKSMFDNIFEKYSFGEIKDSRVAYTPFGIGFKDSAGDYVVYKEGKGNNVGKDMNMDVPLYKMPVAVKDVKKGDIIVNSAVGNNCYLLVQDIAENGIVVIDPMDKTVKTIVPETNLFNFAFYVKVMCPFNMESMGVDESNPFGNLMPFMFMSKDKDNDMFKYMMLMQMCGQKEFNPMMFMMMDKGNDDMFKYMMFMQMNNNTDK